MAYILNPTLIARSGIDLHIHPAMADQRLTKH